MQLHVCGAAVIVDRDAVRSTVLASQIPVDKWHDYLGDPTIATEAATRCPPNRAKGTVSAKDPKHQGGPHQHLTKKASLRSD